MSKSVLLINPAALQTSMREDAVRERYRYPPLGLLSISRHLICHGYQPVVIDFYRDNIISKEDFQQRLQQAATRPIAVGISTYTETFHDAERIAAAVRETFPETRIILGGPHATYCHDEILNDCPFVDYVIRAEGEGAFIELLEHLRNPACLPLASIRGLVYREEGGTRANERRGMITYLDCLPLPPHHLLSEPTDEAGVNIYIVMASRGCPGKCIFCASRALSGPRYRMHSAEWLFSELYANYGDGPLLAMGIMDDTFLVDRKRLRRFCGYLKETELKVSWTCKSRVDTVRDETMALIASSGCTSIHIGAESGDDEVLTSIGKGISVDQILKSIHVIKKHGIRPECSFMIGHHSDTLETIDRTILIAKWMRDKKIGVSIIGISTPLPGTRLFCEADELGLKFLTRNWRDYDLNTVIYETENFGAEDLKRAQYYFDVESHHEPELALNLSGRSQDDLQAKLDKLAERLAALPTERDR